jgi:hypothetical protein
MLVDNDPRAREAGLWGRVRSLSFSSPKKGLGVGEKRSVDSLGAGMPTPDVIRLNIDISKTIPNQIR